MIRRNYMYNKEMELIEKLEHEDGFFVLRPLVPTVSRLEQDCDVLREFLRTWISPYEAEL